MDTAVRSSTIAAAAHRRTAGRYWRLADIAEKEGRIARAREFVAIAMMFDRRAAAVADGSGRLNRIKQSRSEPLSVRGGTARRGTIAGLVEPVAGPAE